MYRRLARPLPNITFTRKNTLQDHCRPSPHTTPQRHRHTQNPKALYNSRITHETHTTDLYMKKPKQTGRPSQHTMDVTTMNQIRGPIWTPWRLTLSTSPQNHPQPDHKKNGGNQEPPLWQKPGNFHKNKKIGI